MRVAVLADIHSNLPALDAVLADVAAAGVDAIVLNGDMATGPMPAQTLERLAGLGGKAVWVRGNADRELAAAYDGELSPDLPMRAAAPGYPDLAGFIAENVVTVPSDAAALAVFSPRSA
jgi:predicted phosphodiesterase